MNYRGPGFLAVIWFGSLPTPSPPPALPSASCLSFAVFLCVAGWAYWRVGGRGGGEEPNSPTNSFDREKAWPSLNKSFNTLCLRPCSILPLCKLFLCIVFPLVFFLNFSCFIRSAVSYLWCFTVLSKRVFRIPLLIGPDPDPCIQTTELWIRIMLFFYSGLQQKSSLFP